MEDLQALQTLTCERIQSEITELTAHWFEHDKEWLIDNSFEISCERQIGWFFDNPDTLNYYEFEEDMLEEIINFDGNFILSFYDYYIGLDENYHNIGAYDSLADMLRDFLGY